MIAFQNLLAAMSGGRLVRLAEQLGDQLGWLLAPSSRQALEPSSVLTLDADHDADLLVRNRCAWVVCDDAWSTGGCPVGYSLSPKLHSLRRSSAPLRMEQQKLAARGQPLARALWDIHERLDCTNPRECSLHSVGALWAFGWLEPPSDGDWVVKALKALAVTVW